MAEYPATVDDIVYWNGATGSPGDVAGTYPSFGRSDFAWTTAPGEDFRTYPGITGFKVVFEAASGQGQMTWDISIDNPGWPGAPEWTADTASHIGLNNDSALLIDVNGPTTWEHVFYQPGDPAFGGFAFVDPLSDLMISLWANASNGYDFNHVTASLDTWGEVVEPIVVTRFQLILFSVDEPEPTGKPFRRVWPREHGRVWPPPRHQHGRRTVGGYL